MDRTQLDYAVIGESRNWRNIKDAAPNLAFQTVGEAYVDRIACRAAMHISVRRVSRRILFTFSMEGDNQPTARNSEVPFAGGATGVEQIRGRNERQTAQRSKGDASVGNSSGRIRCRYDALQTEMAHQRRLHLFGNDGNASVNGQLQSRMPGRPRKAGRCPREIFLSSLNYDGNAVALLVPVTAGR